ESEKDYRITLPSLGAEHVVDSTFQRYKRVRPKKPLDHMDEYKTLLLDIDCMNRDRSFRGVNEDESQRFVLEIDSVIQKSKFPHLLEVMQRLIMTKRKKRDQDKKVVGLRSWYQEISNVMNDVKLLQEGQITNTSFKQSSLNVLQNLLNQVAEQYKQALLVQKELDENQSELEDRAQEFSTLFKKYEQIVGPHVSVFRACAL
ncbi:pgk, partial [Acrasis kona]